MASHPIQPNEQRRRLLKAASAAPVIFTLPVGRPVAAQSIWCTLTQENIITNDQYNDLPESDKSNYADISNDGYVNRQDSCWNSLGSNAPLPRV